ncbi:hypothetical protein ONZ45_g11828 [Pleurotus djamor]|nr:hypothetical protein ONZ45_g11828 [Pleurotus djamor]
MEVLSVHLRRLILEAETAHNHLEKLEERLNTLHEVIVREDSSISLARVELLADLWTKLGRNRNKIIHHDANLALLKDLGSYRSRALMVVTLALQALRGLNDDLEDLRERVSTPELALDIPIKVQIKSIQEGLIRLREERAQGTVTVVTTTTDLST